MTINAISTRSSFDLETRKLASETLEDVVEKARKNALLSASSQPFHPQIVYPTHLLSFIEKLLKESTSNSVIFRKHLFYATSLSQCIHALFENGYFKNESSFSLAPNTPWELGLYKGRGFPFMISVEEKQKIIVLTCTLVGKKASTSIGLEIFIPKSAEWNSNLLTNKVKTSYLLTLKNDLSKKQPKKSLIETYLHPLSTCISKNPWVFKQDPQLDYFSWNFLRASQLSPLHCLQICKDLVDKEEAPSTSNFIYQHGQNQELSHFFDLTSSNIVKTHLNALAQYGHLSQETDSYALCLFIAKLFFLDREQPLITKEYSKQKEIWLNQLKETASSSTALDFELLEKSQGDATRMQKLYQDADPINKDLILKFFLFPFFSDLLSIALEVDDMHKAYILHHFSEKEISHQDFLQIIEITPKMPSLEQIRCTLETAIDLVEKITEIPSQRIHRKHVKEIIEKIFPAAISPFQKSLLTTSFQKFLNDRLIQLILPKTTRFHKNTLEFPFPFSAWIKFENTITAITAFSLRSQLLGKGSYKKAKEAIKATLTLSNDLSLDSKAILRSKECLDEPLFFQEQLLKLPDAEKYFVPCPVKLGSYIGKHGEKIELEDVLYSKSLYKALHGFSANPTTDLTFLDLIHLCKNIASGVEFLKNHQFIHKDIKSDNIFLDTDEQGNKRARIADFDLISPTNEPNTIKDSYIYWNYACQLGYASTETDCYSLILLLAETLIYRLKENNFHQSKTGFSAFRSKFLNNPKKTLIELANSLIYTAPKSMRRLLNIYLSHETELKAYQELLEISRNETERNLLRQAVAFNEISRLLLKAFQADAASKRFLDQHERKNVSIFKESLEQMPQFPTIENIQETIDLCLI